MSKYKVLGIPETIGELKEMIKDYPDSTSFGFSHQPIQELMESTSDDGRTFVTFNELSKLELRDIQVCGYLTLTYGFDKETAKKVLEEYQLLIDNTTNNPTLDQFIKTLLKFKDYKCESYESIPTVDAKDLETI